MTTADFAFLWLAIVMIAIRGLVALSQAVRDC